MTGQAVFLGDSNSVFVARTRNALRERGIKVDLVDTSGLDRNFSKYRVIRAMQRRQEIKSAISKLDPDSTAFMHALSANAVWMLPMLSRHFKRVVALAYGSDILRRKKTRDWLLAYGLRHADVFAATNDNVLDAAVKDFSFLGEKTTRVLRFGLPVFDALDELKNCSPKEARNRLGFPIEATLVALGYAASPGQRQLDLIEQMTRLAPSLPHCHFVVPIQYGSLDVINSVQSSVHQANVTLGSKHFTALTKFHEPDTAAVMRRATSVLINHSISDAFSGTVQEVIYAGNLVLAQADLPYQAMPGFGTAIRSYENLDALQAALSPTALAAHRSAATDSYLETREALRRVASWDGVFEDWCDIIDGDLSL